MNSRFKLVVVSSSTVLVVLLLLGAVMGRSASTEDAYRHLAVYTEVLSRIKSEYVEEPDIKNVTLGAMNGMLESIDPFASYLNPDQYKQYAKSQDAKKANVGLHLSRKFGYVGVVNAAPGSSAARAGLSTGDMLEAINGIATRDMPLAYAEMLLSGEPGSSVELSVMRVRKPEPQKVTLTRAIQRPPAVTSRMLPDQIGLLQAPSLEAGKTKDVVAQLDQLTKQGARKFILDLRYTAMGKPDDGVELANLFLDKGLITYRQGQKLARENYNADPARAIYKSQPLVILSNRGTAGAAEVAAAALLDNKRAEVVGERSYGDAALRRAITMDDGSAVILSVAKFYSPSGKAIQDTGVTPTFLIAETEPFVEGDDDDPATPPQPEKPKEEDAVLKRAVELLTKGKSEADGAAASTPAASPGTGPASRENLPPLVDKNQKK
jgi:carboxyl-terminal processing protease